MSGSLAEVEVVYFRNRYIATSDKKQKSLHPVSSYCETLKAVISATLISICVELFSSASAT